MTTLEEHSFRLRLTPPFRLDLTVWCLRRRPENRVDQWDGSTYRRTLVIDGAPVEVAVTQVDTGQDSHLHITAISPRLGSDAEPAIASTLERMLGLKVDLSEFYRFAEYDRLLGPLARHFLGLKPPRFPTVFETLLNGFACQQITLTACIQILNRLAGTYGTALQAGERAIFSLPLPEDLAGLEPDVLRALGFSRNKSRAIVELSRKVVMKQLDLEGVASLADGDAETFLRQLRGVGPWTAQYVLLRGLGRVHVFPAGDIGAYNKLQRWLERADPITGQNADDILTPWRRYTGLLYFHLLLDDLEKKGYLG